MKNVGNEIDLRQLAIGDSAALGVNTLIEMTLDLESGFRCRCSDESQDHLVGDERLAAPVLSDDEKTLCTLDLVPLARAWRQVAHGDGDPDFVDQLLESTFHRV